MTLYETKGTETHARVWRSLTARDIAQIESFSEKDSLEFTGVQSGKMMKIIPDLDLFHFNGNESDVFEYMRTYRNDDAMAGAKVIRHIKLNNWRSANGYSKLPFYEGQVEIHPLGVCNVR